MTIKKNDFGNNWLSKSLESLEKKIWGAPDYNSYLVTTIHKLRKKALKDFETEDLRIMIGQSFSLKFLIPLALITLEQNILADGDFYEGDLLKAVLTSDPEYWKNDFDNWIKLKDLFYRNIELLKTFDTDTNIRKELFTAFYGFEKINKK